jgi:hypothetical protein
MTSPVSLPSPADDNLRPRQTKVYPYIEYDKFVNDPRIADYLRKNVLRIENLDGEGGDYVSQWNLEPKLRLTPYVFWVDAAGNFRMKNGDPTHDLDGVVIGPGGSLIPHGTTHVFNGTDPVPEIEVLEVAWACPATVVVRDVVYQTGANSVDKALANVIATMPAVGVVRAKPTATTCIIARSGEVPGYTLTADSYYFVSAAAAGAITATPPNTSGSVVQQVGYAKTTSDLVVELSRPLKKA